MGHQCFLRPSSTNKYTIACNVVSRKVLLQCLKFIGTVDLWTDRRSLKQSDREISTYCAQFTINRVTGRLYMPQIRSDAKF